MNENVAIGLIAAVAMAVLVGRAVLRRHRAGEPVGRYALIWAAFFAAAFAVAALLR